jgi:hypothetical protein
MMFADLKSDIRLLHAHNQDRLDVVYDDDKETFQLVEIGFVDWILSIITGSDRLARLQNYARKAQEFFENHPWHFEDEEIDAFFAGGLSKWDFTLFDRSNLPENLHELLSRNLGSPFRGDPSCSFEEETAIETARKEAELALKLGIPPKKNKGFQGSVIYLNYQRKPIGIFKKEHSSSSLYSNVRRVLQTCLGFIRNQTMLSRHEKTHAEVAASVGDKSFSMGGFVPLTRLVTIDGIKGSLQLWSNGMIEAAEFCRQEEPDDEELYLFQIMVIYDFLFGNLDRHLENWLLGLTKMKKLERIAMIDNGSILPEEHPTDSYLDYPARKSMYRWKDHPWSRFPFSGRILERMRELSESKIDDYIDDIRKALPDNGEEFLTKKRIDNLRLRATLLNSIGWANKSSLTPFDLGQAYTSSKLEKLSKAMSLSW